MPMLWTYGVNTGRLTMNEFVAVTSTNIAKILNIYPKKGAIMQGADADIVVWDPEKKKKITAKKQQSAIDYNVFEGKKVQGLPRFVLSRGQLVLNNGKLDTHPGHGEFVRREPYQAVNKALSTWKELTAPRKVERTGIPARRGLDETKNRETTWLRSQLSLPVAAEWGRGAASKLAEEGYKVAILSSSGKGEALAESLGGIGVTGSNQSNDDLKRLVDAAHDKWGRIDVLVNSAGHGPRAPVLELTDEDWHTGMDVYFMNVVRPTRLVAPINGRAKKWRHHQHLDFCCLRTRSGLPDFRRIPRWAWQLTQNSLPTVMPRTMFE